MLDLTGHEINGYVLDRKLNNPIYLANNPVYKAFYRGVAVALKKVILGMQKETNGMNLGDNERRMLEAANKKIEKGVPKLLDYFEIGKDCYVVTELLEGTLMVEFLDRKDHIFSEKDAVYWGRELAAIVVELHKDPILLHTDIKPENIMLTKDGIVLFDFDRSVLWTPDQEYPYDMGTFGYRSLGQEYGTVSPKSDVHAIGGVLLIASTGEDPKKRFYDGEKRQSAIERLSPKFYELIQRCRPSIYSSRDSISAEELLRELGLLQMI
ncbi:MAG: protein kinase [Candidatus Aenigmarchaeota archaeon]|nr:protein kinase [Candidatus Aenigmarchaeota archaeon]